MQSFTRASPMSPTIVFATAVIACIALVSMSSLVQRCEASTFITQVLTHPDHPNKCWHAETNTAVKPGHIINIPYQCVQIVCSKDLRLSGVGCSSEETLDENCHKVPGDRRLTYPACCPRFECVDTNSNEIS